jgi:hypothetical protein
VPGGGGGIPQGPPDSYHNDATPKIGGSALVGIFITVASLAVVQMVWML